MANPEFGVFYHPNDYIRLGRRLMIDLVDTGVATVASVVATIAVLFAWPHEPSTGIAILTVLSFIWVGYFVFLKRTVRGTFGYRLSHARVVNLQGERPSIAALLARLLFVVGGPANFLIDLFWIPTDANAQAIRDKFAHTLVIRADASPLGRGKIVYRTYNMLGTTFYFQEVNAHSEAPAP